MEIIILEILEITKGMEREENYFFQIKKNFSMKDNGKMVNKMVRENALVMMDIHMMENGKMTKKMVKG